MFREFIGNTEIKETVKSAVKSGRFPHAIIIEGEKGSGRHTLAKIIAAAAVCESENAPCGECRVCRLVSSDGHSDVLTYAPDGASFKVDTVRKIRDNAYIMPIEAKRKVNIMLDCDKMNESAQNAFLKVLEEPPSFMVFILVCRSASALLPTVRSRCVTLTVQNPEIEIAADYLETKLNKPRNDILEALENSRGNIGYALSLLSGEEGKTEQAAKEYWQAVLKNDRLQAVKVIFRFEKDRIGYLNFMEELERIVAYDIKRSALGENVGLKSTSLGKVYKLVCHYGDRHRHHIGQPLSLGISQTSMTAEIFTVI